MADGIIVKQHVTSEKRERAKELRRAMTDAECRLWERLRGNTLAGFHFRRQQVIDGFIVDFYCHRARLVVEVDGEIHRQSREYDNDRDEILKSRGLRILRFDNQQVINALERVVEEIEANLQISA